MFEETSYISFIIYKSLIYCLNDSLKRSNIVQIAINKTKTFAIRKLIYKN